MLLAGIGRHGLLLCLTVGLRIGAGSRRLPVQFRGATRRDFLGAGLSKRCPHPDPESEKGDHLFWQLGREEGHVGLLLVSDLQVEGTLLDLAGNDDDPATATFRDPLIGGKVQTRLP